MDLKWIQLKVSEREYLISRHADTERQNDRLSLIEIEQAVLSGIILENRIQAEEKAALLRVLQIKASRSILYAAKEKITLFS